MCDISLHTNRMGPRKSMMQQHDATARCGQCVALHCVCTLRASTLVVWYWRTRLDVPMWPSPCPPTHVPCPGPPFISRLWQSKQGTSHCSCHEHCFSSSVCSTARVSMLQVSSSSEVAPPTRRGCCSPRPLVGVPTGAWRSERTSRTPGPSASTPTSQVCASSCICFENTDADPD